MQLFNKEIDNISCDSRTSGSGTFFFCLTGFSSDGHDFAKSAYDRGCRLFGAERNLNLPEDAKVVLFENTRKAMAEYSAVLYGNPSKKMKMIGVTGTKGKSTVSTLVWQTLNFCGKKAALIGTTGFSMPGKHAGTRNTTPESNILQSYLADAAENGCGYAVVEVSSQAEKQFRVFGIEFDISVFTNLSTDHIGPSEHADYSEYRECKAALFSSSKAAVINADDKECGFFASRCPGKIITYGIKNPSDRKAENIRPDADGFGMKFTVGEREYSIPLAGEFNVSNALAAAAVCEELGLGADEVAKGLESTPGVPGRLEYVDLSSFGVTDRKFIIDYAHNGLSLESVLQTVRPYCKGRLICLFGSIGMRATHRRKELADACVKFADYAIVTSDNPDREDPDCIVKEISGYLGDFPHVCIADRADAVRYAFENSREGDLVLLAGKGHEDYQLINGEKVRFSEKELLFSTAESHYRHN